MSPPELTFDPYSGADKLAVVIGAHNDAMQKYVADRIAAWLDDDDPISGGKLWVYRKNETLKASERTDWAKYLSDVRTRNQAPHVPDIVPCWDIDLTSDYADSTRINLHVALENHSKLLKRGAQYVEHALFQVGMDTELPDSLHRSLRLDRLEPSYRYNRYMSYAAIGYNCAVERVASDVGIVLLRTAWAPRFVQPRVRPLDYPGVVRKMRTLASANNMDGLISIVKRFKDWIAALPGRVDPVVGAQNAAEADREKAAFATHLKQWSQEADAIAAGITLLEESRKHWKEPGTQADPLAIPFEAWRAMNETMANLMQQRNKKDNGEWHLFQLAFILATLPSVVTRMPEYRHRYDAKRDDAVTLLYFSTGGGKSEAFFGLLAFTLFLDRLRGKRFGVTALVRYPLRLLTVNQAQRMARMLAQAEKVRVSRGYPGAAFAIGFWVGSGGTPNHHGDKGVKDIAATIDFPRSIDEMSFAWVTLTYLEEPDYQQRTEARKPR